MSVRELELVRTSLGYYNAMYIQVRLFFNWNPFNLEVMMKLKTDTC